MPDHSIADAEPLPPTRHVIERTRERVSAALQQAYVDGLLTDDELDERLTRANDAESSEAMLALLVGLHAPSDETALVPHPAASTALVHTRGGKPRSLVSVFGDVDDELTLGETPSVSTLAIFADMDLTFREDELASGGTTVLDLSVILGDIKLRVPAGVRIVNEALTILGEIGASKKRRAPTPDATTHTIVLRGFVLLGEVRVRPAS